MDLKERVAHIPYWYHKIELPGGIVTPGWAPLAPKAYRIPEDLTGKRVLDVGAWDGYWSFEAVKRGAAEVVAIDDFSDMINTHDAIKRTAWDAFDLCKEALNIPDYKLRRRECSVYEVPQYYGEFDICFFFGALYHLKHPYLALEILSNVTREEMYIETAICDDYSPYQGGMGKGYADQMVMEFYPTTEYGENKTNWWCPSLNCLAHMVKSLGWDEVRAWKLMKTPELLPQCRGFIKATRNAVEGK